MALRLQFVLMLLSTLAGHRSADGQKTRAADPFPTQVVIGSNYFIDIGPPFDFYSVYVLKSESDGTSVERLSITPHGDACLQPATVIAAKAQTNRSLSEMLDGKNPCAIPEKSIYLEAKRCKHCLIFSGAHIAMQVQCGPASRIIKSEVLDRDMFEVHPNTPQYTAGTYKLLSELDQLFGSNALDKPIFPLSDPTTSTEIRDVAVGDLGSGNFDLLFPPEGETVSSIYAEAQLPHSPPAATVVKVDPIAPSNAKPLVYPPIARLTHTEGTVHLEITIGEGGIVNSVTPIDGQLMLATSAATVAKDWRFDPEFAGKVTETTMDYRMNCSAATHR